MINNNSEVLAYVDGVAISDPEEFREWLQTEQGQEIAQKSHNGEIPVYDESAIEEEAANFETALKIVFPDGIEAESTIASLCIAHALSHESSECQEIIKKLKADPLLTVSTTEGLTGTINRLLPLFKEATNQGKTELDLPNDFKMDIGKTLDTLSAACMILNTILDELPVAVDEPTIKATSCG